MVAVPEVGGNIPVKIDLRDTVTERWMCKEEKEEERNSKCSKCLCAGRVHGGGLSGSVVAQKGSNLALVEVDAEAVDGRFVGAAEDLDQVLDANAFDQINRLWLEERLLCAQQKQTSH